MAPFGGWDMPVQYAGILGEARAVRSNAGMFDVSHMGRLDIRGPGAATFLGRVLSSDISRLRMGRARYGVICDREGGIIDDAIVYRLGDDRFLLIPNAANSDAVPDGLETDLDGNPRFLDDPETKNTGRGAGCPVDMGAYEFQDGRCE